MPQVDESPQYLTEAEAAELLRRSPATLTRWRRLRTSPPVAVVQGRVLYPREKLEAWIAARVVEGQAV